MLIVSCGGCRGCGLEITRSGLSTPGHLKTGCLAMSSLEVTEAMESPRCAACSRAMMNAVVLMRLTDFEEKNTLFSIIQISEDVGCNMLGYAKKGECEGLKSEHIFEYCIKFNL